MSITPLRTTSYHALQCTVCVSVGLVPPICAMRLGHAGEAYYICRSEFPTDCFVPFGPVRASRGVTQNVDNSNVARAPCGDDLEGFMRVEGCILSTGGLKHFRSLAAVKRAHGTARPLIRLPLCLLCRESNLQEPSQVFCRESRGTMGLSLSKFHVVLDHRGHQFWTFSDFSLTQSVLGGILCSGYCF